jgi:hypothetical protein
MKTNRYSSKQTLWCSIFAILFLSLCGNQDGSNQKTAQADSLLVHFSFSLQTAHADSQWTISGSTDLPDSTRVVVTMSDPVGKQMVVKPVQVYDGIFGPVSLGLGRGFRSGEYKVTAATPHPSQQPLSVQAVLGKHGEKMYGDNVIQNSGSTRFVALNMGVTVNNANDSPPPNLDSIVFSVSRLVNVLSDKDKDIGKEDILQKMILVRGEIFDIVPSGNPAGPFFVLSYVPEGSQYEQGAIRCFFLRNFPNFPRGKEVVVKGRCNGKGLLYIDMAFCSLK